VVGVILNLSIWFALHVFFTSVETVSWGVVHTSLPDISPINWRAVIIAICAGIALLRFHTGIIKVLVVAAFAGWVTSLI
jgi:chromate transporter